MKLTSAPARPLTNRETAKILCGSVGTLVEMTDEKTLEEALDWFFENRAEIVRGLQAAKNWRG